MERNENEFQIPGIFSIHRSFYIMSIVFYLLYYGGLLIYLAKADYNAFEVAEIQESIVLLGLVPLLLLSIFEYFYQSNRGAREFFMTLPFHKKERFLAAVAGDYLCMAISYILFAMGMLLVIRLRMPTEFANDKEKYIAVVILGFLYISRFYLVLQMFLVNCKNKLLGIGLAAGWELIKIGSVLTASLQSLGDAFASNYYHISPLLVYMGNDFDSLGDLRIDFIFTAIEIVILIALIVIGCIHAREDAKGQFYHEWFRVGFFLLAGFFVNPFYDWMWRGFVLGAAALLVDEVIVQRKGEHNGKKTMESI